MAHMISDKQNNYIIVTGTDPESAKGGIGVVLPGYFTALRLAGFVYECIPTYYPASLKGKWLPWLKALPVLFRSIQEEKRKNYNVIVYSHVGDGISFFRETCVLWLAKFAGAKTILQVHSPKVDGYLEYPLKRFLLKIALIPADTICVLTDWWKNRLTESGIKGNICVIPNPLPDDLLEIAEQAKNKKDGDVRENINILSMARLVPGKGVDIMISAMSHLPENVFLTIAGDGEQRKELEKLSSDLGVAKRINFAGWVSGNKKKDLLKMADIFCLPSTYDAFPMSMVEAMAYGIPVVAVRWGGIPDMVSDGYSGFLAKRAQPDEISDAVKKLLDDDVRYKTGKQAKNWVIEISHPEYVAKKMRHVIKRLFV